MDQKQVYSYLSLFTDADNFSLFSDEDLNFIGYHLSRQEEKDNPTRGQLGNWDFTYSDSDYTRPFVDEFVIDKLTRHGIERKSIWKNNKPFAIWLTHDLDLVSEQDPVPLNRYYKKVLLASNSPGEKLFAYIYFFVTWFRSFFKHKNDVLWHYEKWYYAEYQMGFSSTWYIYAQPDLEKQHLLDCNYFFEDKLVFRGHRISVSDFIRFLNKEQQEIGVHGSYFTWQDAELLKKQKQAIENITGSTLNTTRQHFLHFDIHTTPAVQEQSGFKTDSTIGYSRTIGFRAGTCYPYYINNTVLEIPLIIMDVSLFRSMNLNLDEAMAKKRILEMFDKIESVGGCLTINFHPNNFVQPAWWNTYLFILNEAKKRNAHCTSAREMRLLVEEKSAVKV